MKDPLAGQRENVNEGADHLVWPDQGKGCPVEIGDVFNLRTCSIEITHRRRQRDHGRFLWLAWFTRYYPEGKVFLLDRKGGYTHDDDSAMRAQDDPKATTVTGDPMHNPLNLNSPPEPEAIPPHQVAELPTTIAAAARFEQEKGDDVAQRLQRSVIEELREALAEARRAGIDIQPTVGAVRAQIAAVNGKRRTAA